MKKLNSILLVLFSFMVVACSNADPVEQNGTSDRSPEISSQNQDAGGSQVSQVPQVSRVPQVPAAMVSLNYSLSVNYARLSWSASYVQSAFLRVSANYSSVGSSQNYRDVMLPLTQTNHAGLVKFRLPSKQSVFTIYYRDWANHLNKKEIKVTQPS